MIQDYGAVDALQQQQQALPSNNIRTVNVLNQHPKKKRPRDATSCDFKQAK